MNHAFSSSALSKKNPASSCGLIFRPSPLQRDMTFRLGASAHPSSHGISFRDFAISPDGHSLAVVITGKRSLLVFRFPADSPRFFSVSSALNPFFPQK